MYKRFLLSNKRGNGTVEIFGGKDGVLRIDLAKEYECRNSIIEIAMLAISTFAKDFGIGSIKVKTANVPERIKWLEQLGFIQSKTFRPELGYHEFDVVKTDNK